MTRRLMRGGVMVLVLGLGLAGCSRPDPFAAPHDVAAPPPDALRTPSGIATKVVQVGLGSVKPSLNSRVTVHYTGWTADGTMFESSHTRREPATFEVDRVIPGWTEVLLLMVEGEKRRAWIPGALAYDGSPNPDDPKGMLVFDIELLDIH